MSKTRKIWLGIFTFLPIVLFIAFFIIYFMFIFSIIGNVEAMENNSGQFPTEFMASFVFMFIFIMIASLGGLVLMIYYIMHANNNEANDSNKKLMWTLVLIFTSSIGTIVYYFVEILPIKTEDKVINQK